jgi:hypothetical protein
MRISEVFVDGASVPVSAVRVRTAGDSTVGLTVQQRFFKKRLMIRSEFNSFLAGERIDYPYSIRTDDAGHIYILMSTYSFNMPEKNAFQPAHNPAEVEGGPQDDLYLAALDCSGKQLRWATYVGGSRYETDFAWHQELVHPVALLDVHGSGICYATTNTTSLDFPTRGPAVQQGIPDVGIGPMPVIMRFDQDGTLRTSSYFGGPTAAYVNSLHVKEDTSVYFAGFCHSNQWFVPRGAYIDTLKIQKKPIDAHPGLNYLYQLPSSGFVAHLSPDLDSVRAATYLLVPMGNNYPVYIYGMLQLLPDGKGHLIIAGDTTSTYSTQIPSSIYIDSLRSFIQVLSENLRDSVRSILLHPAKWSVVRAIKNARNGDVIVCCDADTILSAGTKTYHGVRGFITRFDDIARGSIRWSRGVPGMKGTISERPNGDVLFYGESDPNALSGIPTENNANHEYVRYFTRYDSVGVQLRYSGMWYADDEVLSANPVVYDAGYAGPDELSAFGTNGHICLLAAAALARTFNAFQATSGGAEDGFMMRTHIPGERDVALHLQYPDTLLLRLESGDVHPSSFDVCVEVENTTGDHVPLTEVSCVLDLPPGLTLAPDTQSTELWYTPFTLAPGGRAQRCWHLRLDPGTWDHQPVPLSVVCYYRRPENHTCIRNVDVAYDTIAVDTTRLLTELQCSLRFSDTLRQRSDGQGYVPDIVRCNVRLENTGPRTVDIAQLRLWTGRGMGLRTVPVGDELRGSLAIPPGEWHEVGWTLRPMRSADARTIDVGVVALSANGAVLASCGLPLPVPGMPQPQCRVNGTVVVRYDAASGMSVPDTVRCGVTVINPCDTMLVNAEALIDLAGAPHLRLHTGENPLHGPIVVLDRREKSTSWRLAAAGPQPSGQVTDTVWYQVRRAGAANTEWCAQPVTILPLEQVMVYCTLAGPDALTVDDSTYVPGMLTGRVMNALQTRVELARLRLESADVTILDPADAAGGWLDAGAWLERSWRVTAPASAYARRGHAELQCYDGSDALQAVCPAEMDLPGIAALRCALTLPDSVRYKSVTQSYDPSPVPLALKLWNVLDTACTDIEAEVDLTAAPRLRLQTGDVALRTRNAIAAHEGADITWLLDPRADSVAAVQTLTVRYRWAGTEDWRSCTASTVVAAWPAGSTGVDAPAPSETVLLGAPWPQPVRADAQVHVRVTARGTADVGVWDLLGRCVATVHTGVLPPDGILRFQPSALGLAPGGYLLRALTANGAAVRMFTVVR